MSLRAAWAVDDLAISIDAGTQSLRPIEGAPGLRQELRPTRVRDRVLGLHPRPQRAAVLTNLPRSTSLSQEVREALGAQAGEAKLSQVLEDAGFSRVRRATEGPFNMVRGAALDYALLRQ